jgi:hypothetical protein
MLLGINLFKLTFALGLVLLLWQDDIVVALCQWLVLLTDLVVLLGW